ncbi:MAG: sulfatase-like hydrolase/transferase, partial [Thalassolituus sp.]
MISEHYSQLRCLCLSTSLHKEVVPSGQSAYCILYEKIQWRENQRIDIDTPNIDALAANGIRFKHCYSTPVCTPSRVMIMTGKYNFRNYTHFG